MVPTQVVSADEWTARRERLLIKGKQLGRARDPVAAERRRLPMVAFEKDHRLEGPDGERSRVHQVTGGR